MKPQRIFLSMGQQYDPVVKAVQDVCKTQDCKDLMVLGDWEFEIKRHQFHGWWCSYIVCEFDVWLKLKKHERSTLKRMREYIDERVETFQTSQ